MPLLAREARLAPDIALAQFNFGWALYLAGEKEKAEVQLRTAAELEPNNIQFLLTLIRFYERYERWTDGLPWAERLYQLMSDKGDAARAEAAHLLDHFRQQAAQGPTPSEASR